MKRIIFAGDDREENAKIRAAKELIEAHRCKSIKLQNIAFLALTMRRESLANRVTRVRTTRARSEFRIINEAAFRH